MPMFLLCAGLNVQLPEKLAGAEAAWTTRAPRNTSIAATVFFIKTLLLLRSVERDMHRDEPSHQGHRPEMSATQYATIGLSWGSKHQTHRDLPQHDQERDGRDPDPGEA